MRQRIAILAAAMDPGGAERVALNLAEHLAQLDLDVDLVLVRARGALLGLVPPNVRIVDLGAARAATAIRTFRAYLKRERPAAVMAVNFEVNLTAAVAALGLGAARPRLILSVHCAPAAYFAPARRPWAFAMEAASKWLYPKADKVIPVSLGIADELVQRGWCDRSRIEVIYNPVVRPDFPARASRPVPIDLGTDAEGPLVVNVGRLNRQKNHSLLLRAIAALAPRRRVRLALVGDGDLRGALTAEAEALGVADRVHFAGHQENPYPFMRAADLFVLSSDWEGHPLVLIEAMAAGTRLVATDCRYGPAEILENGRWGRLVPCGDADRLAEAIDAALDDPRPGEEAVRHAMGFSVAASAEAYLRVMLGRP